MKTNIFLPQKINVGQQERSDTYTGRLAYVIYFDEKGKLRKEASWNSWCNKKLGNDIYENVPTSGFVLNKKVGGYNTGWNHRQTYVRVYDPRGFEFEINVPNLLYILENATSTKGKGLEGEFVYGWDGTDLVLVPVDSPDYQELTKINEFRHAQNFTKAKDLKIGATYLAKDNVEHIYIGRFDEYDGRNKKDKQSFYFYNRASGYFSILPSISQKFVAVVSEDCAEDYSDIFEKLEHNSSYSPIDENGYEYVPYTLEEFVTLATARMYYFYCYKATGEPIQVRQKYDSQLWFTTKKYSWENETQLTTLEEVFATVNPMWRKVYLTNGKLYREDK